MQSNKMNLYSFESYVAKTKRFFSSFFFLFVSSTGSHVI